jgi:hypothetical protein
VQLDEALRLLLQASVAAVVLLLEVLPLLLVVVVVAAAAAAVVVVVVVLALVQVLRQRLRVVDGVTAVPTAAALCARVMAQTTDMTSAMKRGTRCVCHGTTQTHLTV